MSTPTTAGHNRPATTQISEPEMIYHYPEDFSIPESGFYYGQLLYCILERANAILQYLITDLESETTTLQTCGAAYTIEGLLKQGPVLAEQLQHIERNEPINNQEVTP